MKALLLLLISTTCISFPKKHEITVATMFRNEAKYLKEWIEYHKNIGVDHFCLYDNDSQDNFREVLAPYIESGLVEIRPWSNELAKGQDASFSYGFVKFQVEALKHAVTSFVGKSEWFTFIDIDEFIVPMKEWTLQDCLKKHYSNINAIYMNWRNFGTSFVNVPEGEGILTYLTKCSLKGHPRNYSGKTLVKPEICRVELVHYPHHLPLTTGNRYFNGSGKEMEHFDGIDLQCTEHSDKYLRVNHYALRDENYFWNKRMKRHNAGYGGDHLFKTHHSEFSLLSDKRIIQILKHHKKMK